MTKEIFKKYELLSKEDERKYIELSKSGDVYARQKLVLSIMPLIISLAGKISKICKLEVEDLINDGVIGAYKAIDAFDLSYSNRFSSFAMNTGYVLAEMQKSIKNSHLVGISVSERKSGNRNTYISFDKPISDKEKSLTFAEVISDVCDDNVLDFSTINFDELIGKLRNEDDRHVLKLFSEGYTTRDIEKIKGISRQTAINKREKAIKTLRKILSREGKL